MLSIDYVFVNFIASSSILLYYFSIGFEGKYDESNYIHIVEKAF